MLLVFSRSDIACGSTIFSYLSIGHLAPQPVFTLLSSSRQVEHPQPPIMPGGKRNPFSVTTLLQTIEGLVRFPKSKAKPKSESKPVSASVFVDLEIQVGF